MPEPMMRAAVIVTFPSAGGRTPAEMRALLESAGPEYAEIPGLLRKYFLVGDGVAGGVYEWADRALAESFHDAAWRQRMTESYGAPPDVAIFDLPAVADGINHRLEIFLPGGG